MEIQARLVSPRCRRALPGRASAPPAAAAAGHDERAAPMHLMRLPGRRLALAGAAWLVATGLAGAAAQAAEGPALTILLSDADGIHGEVAETLRRDLEKSGTEPAEIVVATVPAPLARVPGRLLLTVGTQALQSALGQDLRAPILAVLLPRQAFERLADHAGRRAAHSVSALFLDQPVVRQLDLIRLALPAYFGRR